MSAILKFGGPRIDVIWAWIVTDHAGAEAICRSPWSETAVLMGPDRDTVAAPAMAQWVRAYYEPLGMTVQLRSFGLDSIE